MKPISSELRKKTTSVEPPDMIDLDFRNKKVQYANNYNKPKAKHQSQVFDELPVYETNTV